MAFCCDSQILLRMVNLNLELASQFPVMVYDVLRNQLTVANNADEYVTIWNADASNSYYGTISKQSNFTFSFTPNAGVEFQAVYIYGVFQVVTIPTLTAPTNLTFSEITQSTAKANWLSNPAVSSPIGYAWQNTTDSTFQNITNGSGSGSGWPNPPVQALTGLPADTDIFFRVRKIDTGLPQTNNPSPWVSGTYRTLPNIIVQPTTHNVLFKSFGNADPFVNEQTALDISGSLTKVINNGSNITSDALPVGWNNTFIMIAEPATEPIKNTWENTNTNNGALTPNGDAAFRKPWVVANTRFYLTRDAAGFAFATPNDRLLLLNQ